MSDERNVNYVKSLIILSNLDPEKPVNSLYFTVKEF